MAVLLDRRDLDVNGIADFDDFGRMRDLMIGELADMDKAVDAGNEFRERAERHDADDPDVRLVAYRVFLRELVPRIHAVGLVRERNALLFSVESLDGDVNDVADVDDFGRMLDSEPRKLGIVDHAVHSAEIDERAVGGEGSDFAVKLLALFDVRPEFFLFRAALFSLYRADGSVRFLSVGLDLDDLDSLRRADEDVKVVVARHSGQGRGNEYSDAEQFDDHAALDGVSDLALEDLARLVSRDDLVPVEVGIDSVLVEHRDALDVRYFDDFRLDDVADVVQIGQLSLRIVRRLVVSDYAGRFRSEVELDLGVRNVTDNAFDDIS